MRYRPEKWRLEEVEMPIPRGVTRLNRRVLNPLMRLGVGIGPLAEVEHVGRRSGRVRRTPILAWRDRDRVTVALTYGPDVDWLKNLEIAGGGRMRLHTRVLALGAPLRISTTTGRARMPAVVRGALMAMRVTEFIEFRVLDDGRVGPEWHGRDFWVWP